MPRKLGTIYPNAMKKGIYIRTDELLEAIKALEVYLSNLRRVKRDRYYWKWAIIALHNSVQGFMVSALRGTNGLAVLTPECARAWMDAYRNRTPYPKEKLDDFLNLYKKIKSNLMLQYGQSKKFTPKGQQGWSIKKLNALRNEFIHFTPKGWSLEVSGLPSICEDLLSIIDFLANSSGNIDFYQQSAEKRFQDALDKAKTLTKELRRAYAT